MLSPFFPLNIMLLNLNVFVVVFDVFLNDLKNKWINTLIEPGHNMGGIVMIVMSSIWVTIWQLSPKYDCEDFKFDL